MTNGPKEKLGDRHLRVRSLTKQVSSLNRSLRCFYRVYPLTTQKYSLRLTLTVPCIGLKPVSYTHLADEHAKLLELYGKEILEWMLETLNCYLGSSGKKYASHYFVLKKNGWVYKRYQEEVVNNPSLKKKGEYQRSGKLVIEADKMCIRDSCVIACGFWCCVIFW